MPTDTQHLAPTDAEIVALLGDRRYSTVGAVREAITRWGQPAVAGERVDRADAVNLARNTLTQHDSVITKKGVRVLAEAVLSMDAAINAARKQGVNHD